MSAAQQCHEQNIVVFWLPGMANDSRFPLVLGTCIYPKQSANVIPYYHGDSVYHTKPHVVLFYHCYQPVYHT